MERLQCRGDPAVLFFPRQFSLHRIDRWIFKSYGLKESCNLSELVPLDAEVPQLLKRAGDSVNPNVPVALFRKKSRLSIFGLFLLEVPRVSFYGRDSRSPYLVHDSADTEERNSVIVGIPSVDTVYFDLSRRVYIFPIVQVECHVRDFAGGVAEEQEVSCLTFVPLFCRHDVAGEGLLRSITGENDSGRKIGRFDKSRTVGAFDRSAAPEVSRSHHSFGGLYDFIHVYGSRCPLGEFATFVVFQESGSSIGERHGYFPAFPAACRIQPDTMSDTVSAFLSAEAYT